MIRLSYFQNGLSVVFQEPMLSGWQKCRLAYVGIHCIYVSVTAWHGLTITYAQKHIV